MSERVSIKDSDISSEIQKILYGYVKAQSFSYSEGEKTAEEYFINYFSDKPYFMTHKDYLGRFSIKNDPFDRSVVWSMVKGKGNNTVVLIHHYDVVTVEDFKLLKSYAFSPDELEIQLLKIKDSLADEAKKDLESGNYLFGRGVCDMKGGGSIQMALLNEYSKMDEFTGNVIVIGVPDEENLSAGMRSAVVLLDELREKYNLKYQLMINSEPHQRKIPNEGIFSFGSIGKIMPYVYVRGSLAHAGKVFEGLNPTNVMSEIVRRTEMNMDLSDVVGDEASPPPTWLYLRENKTSYDVSMPLTINGCLSILTLNQSPKHVLDSIRDICEKSFYTVISEMNKNYERFLKSTKQEYKRLPWKQKVVDFGELYKEALATYGSVFEKNYENKIRELESKIQNDEESLITANFELVDFVYNYIDDLSPRVVIGLIPPYYPNVANVFMDKVSEEVKGLYNLLSNFVMNEFNQKYTSENFYTGISDLSYASISNGKDVKEALRDSMPFFEKLYSLPIREIERNSMPCINIGPWGKDFHKLTERVYKEDLYIKTPIILDFAIKKILK